MCRLSNLLAMKDQPHNWAYLVQDLHTGIMKMYTSLQELAAALGMPLQQLDRHFEQNDKRELKLSTKVEVVKLPYSGIGRP